MSSVVISGDTSGAITLAAPSVAGTNTITLPAATGTVMVSGNMPAFSAQGTGTQSFANATNVKVAFNTKVYDTASCYDTTNYRFLPNVAGYYQFNANIIFTGAAVGVGQLLARRSGSNICEGSQIKLDTNGLLSGISFSCYMNGTTDYVEIFGWQNSGGALNCGATGASYTFTGFLVRTA